MRDDATPYLLIAPAILALAVTVAYPIGYNVFISLFDWNILDSDAPVDFVGLGNYADILADPSFLHSLWVTASFTVLAVGVEFVLGPTGRLGLVVAEAGRGRLLSYPALRSASALFPRLA